MIETTLDMVNQLFHELLFDARKRLFWGYLLLSAGIAIVLLRSRGYSFTATLHTLFKRSIWWSASAKADYSLLSINSLLFTLISPLLLSKLTVATLLFHLLQTLLGAQGPQWTLSEPAVAILFTLCLLILDDFARYILHRLLHTVPWLWAFHQVHHSAQTMTPFTVLRTHPVEGILFALRGALVQGICIALFVYGFAEQVDLVTVWGASVSVFLFNIAGSNLRHSHIAWHYWPWLEHILISPAQHQIHHSTAPRHFDKNFGAILALWDTLFGSLHLAEPNSPLTFGLAQQHGMNQQVSTLYLKPFQVSYRTLKRQFLNK